MFRISHIIGVHRQHDRRCLEEIHELFEAAFPDVRRATPNTSPAS